MGWQDDPLLTPATASNWPPPEIGKGKPWESDPIVATTNELPPVGPTAATGPIQSIQAGLQASTAGLFFRGKLPDLVMDPQHASWWERALTGTAQVAADLPAMALGGAFGAAAGGAAGTAIGPAGTAAGTVLGTGAGMFGVPALMRELLINGYKSGEIKTAADFWNALRAGAADIAEKTAKEAAVGMATFGAGSLAARTVGKALVPAIGESIAVPTATKIIGATDTAAQIAAMVSMPAALQGRLPDAQEFIDAAIVIGGLKLAHPLAARITNVFAKTGKTPAEQVADAQANPELAKEMVDEAARAEPVTPTFREQLTKQEELWSIQDRMAELAAKPGGASPAEVSVALSDYADNMQLRGAAKTWAENLPGLPRSVYEALSRIPPPERGTAQEGQLQELRRRVLEARENPADAMRAVWGRDLADAPPDIRRAIESGMALPEAPLGSPQSLVGAPPRFSPDQLTEAQDRAKTRLEELSAKSIQGALTDAERAERVYLTNAMANPEGLAKRFGMEPAIKAPTASEFDASARRVYDDVLRQAQEADANRLAGGQDPLGDAHAQAVAELVASEVRNYGRMLGRLPEDIYRERYLTIRNEGVAAQEAAQTEAERIANPEAPTFEPKPELDLFGNPVAPSSAPQHAAADYPVVKIPLGDIKLSTDVPQFKAGANAKGVVQPLQGEVDLRGVPPVALWERLNGDLELISGRHRLDLWERKGMETIDAQIFREADGFDARQAAMLDAEMNIRDEHGSVSDYANYFKNSGISEADAKARGLLGRAKGQAGFAIARDGTPDLVAAHRAGLLSDDAALAISTAAPGSERLQAVGIAMVNDGKSILYATNTMKAVDLMAAERMAAGQQGDIFGFDDSAMREAAAMAKKASSAQRKISEQISAVSGASRRPDLARKLGVDVQDPEGIQKKIAELKQEQYQWDNWPLYPELVAKLRASDTLNQEPIDIRQENFKRWFGDSKVVDAEGKPLVVYHGTGTGQYGTPTGGITKFELRGGMTGKLGFWFASAPEATAPFARERYAGEGPAVYPVFLSLRKPMVYDGWKALVDAVNARPGDSIESRSLSLRRNLMRAGYDGIINRNSDTDSGVLRDDYVAFRPEQIKSAIGNRGTFDPNNPNILYQDDFELKPETPAELKARDEEAAAAAKRKLAQERAGVKGPVPTADQADLFNTQRTLFQDKEKPWYYSELARSIESSPMKQGTAKAWQDYIKSRVGKGVKPEEIEATGTNDWLKTQEGKVTKEQVQAFMEQGGVKVTETLLGESHNPYDAFVTKMEEKYGEGYDTQALTPAERAEQGRLWDLTQQRGGMTAGHTTFQDYQLPGSVPGSYRELVLTLPSTPKTLDEIAISMGFGGWTASLSAERQAAVERAYEAQRTKPGGTFESTHFPGADYLAHTRVNDRILPDGRKVLFVEEIQSDRAQKGRTEGFRAPATREEATAQGYSVYRAKDNHGGQSYFLESKNTDWSLTNHGFDTEDKAWAALLEHMAAKNGNRIAPAPFVTKTDSWTALVLKRLLRYAAEGNYDAIAWTRGEQQVERYTSALRKAVDTIEWKKTPEGVQIVGYKGSSTARALSAAEIDRMQGLESLDRPLRGVERDELANLRARLDTRTKVVDTTEKESALSDAIGKSMADRIRNDPNQTGTIEGDNITVSDTGMAGYYDRIVPKVAAEVAKKVGGGKVTEIALPTPTEGTVHDRGMPVEVFEGQSPGGWYIRYDSGQEFGVWPSKQSAQEAMTSQKALVEQGKPTTKQQAIEITPTMREKIMAGQALFQKPGQERDGQHLGSYEVADRIVTLFENANKSTVVHELGHHFLENLKYFASQPDAPPRVKAMWETARKEFAIGEDGNISTASHEMNARSFERYLGEGKTPSIGLRAVFEQFKNWMLEIYKNLQNIGVQINPEVRGLFDRMLATDQEIADAKELGVPKAYVPEARRATAEKIVPPPVELKKIEPGFEAEQASMIPFADELPPGPGEAPENTHINYAYVNGPLDMKLTMQRMAEIDQANIQRQRGGGAKIGVKTWEEARAEQAAHIAEMMGGTPDQVTGFLNRFLGPAPEGRIDRRLGILKRFTEGAVKDAARLRDVVLAAGHDATIRQQLEYMGAWERMRMIQAEMLAERASVARAMNALKDTTEGSGEIARMLDAIGYGEAAARELFQAARTPAEEQAYLKAQLDEILQRYVGRKKGPNGKTVFIGSVLDIANLHKEIGTLKGSFRMAKELEKATSWEMVVEAWKAGLLSGPVTHTTNLFGTGAFQAMRVPVDALAAIIGMARGASPGMGESDRASMSEAVGRVTGMLGGVQDALKVAYHAFMADQSTGKTESYREAIPGRAGRIIRIPLRLMGAEDAMVTAMYLRGELRTLAIRQAFDEQMNPATVEFAKRVDYLMDHPAPELQARAELAATRMTFNLPLGEKGRALQTFVNKWNLQWMIPFIRTPINIAKELLRMSPFAPVVAEWRAAMRAGGVERDRAIAEIALGSGITALTMAYAFAGNISGGGSPDPGRNRARQGVWQPYSIKIGDTWYEYARIQPTGTLMGMAADIAQIWDHMTDEEKDKVPKMLAAAFAQAITNQTFLQGITNFVNAMSDPTRFGPRFMQQFAGSMVPNIIGQPTAMADPQVREINSMIEAVQARIPGFREQLLPKRDWLGEAVPTKERVGAVMPVRTQEISTDKVRLEADRLGLSVAAAPKKTHIGKGTGKIGDVEFTPEERDKFEQAAGQMAHPILTNIVNAPGYDQIPDLIKKQIFHNVLLASHKFAAAMALPVDKKLAYIQQITERMATQLRPAEQ